MTKSELLKVNKVNQRKKVLGEFTMMKDLADIPITNEPLLFDKFNPDYYSHDREF